MRTKFRLFVAALFLVSCAFVPLLVAQEMPHPSRHGVDLEVTEEDGIYLIVAKITDLESGKVLAVPQIRTTADEEAIVRIGTNKNGIIEEMIVRVEVGSGYLNYRFEFLRGEEVISAQESRIRYPQTSDAAKETAEATSTEQT